MSDRLIRGIDGNRARPQLSAHEPAGIAINLAIGYHPLVTWREVIRKLKAAGYVEARGRKGSHRLFKHPATGKEIWIAVHTKKDAGQLGNRILREAGIQ